MASYRNKLPAAGGGSQPSFQRGVYAWSAGTTAVIPISVVPASNSFITQIRASFIDGTAANATTFTASLKSTGDGIALSRVAETGARTLNISWEVCTDPTVSVQRGVQAFTTTQQEFNITIPEIANLSRASARIVGLASSYEAVAEVQLGFTAVRCELAANSIKLRRDVTSRQTKVSWEVVTYV